MIGFACNNQPLTSRPGSSLDVMTALIELRNLVKDYGSFRALNGVNLTIGEGITGLL